MLSWSQMNASNSFIYWALFLLGRSTSSVDNLLFRPSNKMALRFLETSESKKQKVLPKPQYTQYKQ
jgi:hypothetical protein